MVGESESHHHELSLKGLHVMNLWWNPLISACLPCSQWDSSPVPPGGLELRGMLYLVCPHQISVTSTYERVGFPARAGLLSFCPKNCSFIHDSFDPTSSRLVVAVRVEAIVLIGGHSLLFMMLLIPPLRRRGSLKWDGSLQKGKAPKLLWRLLRPNVSRRKPGCIKT